MAMSNYSEVSNKYVNSSFLIYEVPDSKYDKCDVTNSSVYPMSEILLDIATEKDYEYGEDCMLTRIADQFQNVHILIDMNFSKETGALSRADLENYFHTLGQIISFGVPLVKLFGQNCWVIRFFEGSMVRRMYGTEHIIRGIRVKFKEYDVGDEFVFGDPNIILLELVDEKKGTFASEDSNMDERRVDFNIRVIGDESSRESALNILNEVLKIELGKIDRELKTMQRFLTRIHDQKYFETKILSIGADILLKQEKGEEEKSNQEIKNENFDNDSVPESLGEPIKESKKDKKKKKKKKKKSNLSSVTIDNKESSVLNHNSDTSPKANPNQSFVDEPRVTSVKPSSDNLQSVEQEFLTSSSPPLLQTSVSSVKPTAEKLSVIEIKKRNIKECKNDLIENLEDVRNEIEEQIRDKEKEYEAHQQNISKMIETQSEEMSSIINNISRAEDEIARNDKEVQNLDKEIRDHELEIIRKRKMQKQLHLKSEENSSLLKNFNGQKKIIEDKSNAKLELAKKQGEVVALTLNLLKEDLKENIKATEDLTGKHDNKTDSIQANEVSENTNGFIDFLAKSIKDKEADLECPVCMETADIPIYMCQQMHLVCSNCRPMLDICPECREEYQDMRRHRYAEKTAEELKELKQVAKQSSEHKDKSISSVNSNQPVEMNDCETRSTDLPRLSLTDEHDRDVPRQCQLFNTLPHGERVHCVAMSNPMKYVYTGGEETIKVWDIRQSGPMVPVAEVADTSEQFYADGTRRVFKNSVKCLKLVPDGKTLVSCGTVWDLAGPIPRVKAKLPPRCCCGLSIRPDSKLCYFSDKWGVITTWDLHNQSIIKQFQGPDNFDLVEKCMVLSADGTKLYTGECKQTLRCWDIREGKELQKYNFSSDIHCLDISSKGDLLAVGLGNSHVEFLNLNNIDRHHLNFHQFSVVGLKIANSGKWYASSSLKKEVVVASIRGTNPIFKTKENHHVESFDISKDDKFVATAGGYKRAATIYEMIY